MNGVSGINNNSYQNNLYHAQLSSGKKHPTAAAGPVETAVLQKEIEQLKGYEAGLDNISSAESAARIADGGMSGVTDSLQRIEELSVRMANGTMSESDKEIYRNEISQMADGIGDALSSTKYNEQDLLKSDGTVSVATDSNGGTQGLRLQDLSELVKSIKSGDYDIESISNALDKVSSGRSRIGAQTNALEHAMNINRNSAYDVTTASSRLGDTEYGGTISNMKRNEALQNYQIQMQRRQIQNQQTAANGWMMSL
ncbi:MAG: hypothetical protein K5985_00110 [Lachnospiraceae bacterium]|nr:hypothetical protein [Lachnospiraceae bacterium]